MLGSVRRAMRNGSNQKSSDIEMNDRSLITSDTSARANMVTIPPTWEGMASRLILIVLNLELMYKMRPLSRYCGEVLTQDSLGKV